ncbi:MAG TPA: hypothetical protein HA356_07425 [Candidatus Poseidoniaceae archaeon]|nr:MAG TPA: hypothetical protein D7H95_07400 [Candidatus Poseidoniales archaeon]HII11886.1 hypothetical protein [Candidatus Poseidoniaceae archaeon]|tara:strand:+ start:2312 stop:2938 length:627 start_codon:yes stop_codon:yes gene_type:complete
MRVTHLRPTIVGIALMVVLLAVPSFSSVPTGVGSLGDQGCTCHGGDSNDVLVSIRGLPAAFESNTSYNLSIAVEGSVAEHKENHQGGFRLTVTGEGIVAFENTSQSQFLDDGWTHQNNGTYQRMWNFTWTSPETSKDPVEFIVHGNAVNGNELSSGDEWNSFGQAIGHVDNPLPPEQPVFDRDIGPLDWAVFTFGLSALTLFFIRAVR